MAFWLVDNRVSGSLGGMQRRHVSKIMWVSNRDICDVTYREDYSQVRTGNGPQVMATIRNLAIAIIKVAGTADIVRHPLLRHECHQAPWPPSGSFRHETGYYATMPRP